MSNLRDREYGIFTFLLIFLLLETDSHHVQI